jgi:hypothetical protein
MSENDRLGKTLSIRRFPAGGVVEAVVVVVVVNEVVVTGAVVDALVQANKFTTASILTVSKNNLMGCRCIFTTYNSIKGFLEKERFISL